jgi:dihydrofolate synthase/folylpolyglutamate synthase
MQQRALEVGAPFYTVQTVLPEEDRTYRRAKVDRISGSVVNEDIDDLNIDISRAALKLLQQHGPPVFGQLFPSNSRNSVATQIEAGLSSRPPCRYQLLSPPGDVDVILDIAHNEDAIAALVGKLRTHYPYPTPLRVVLGMSADKDVGKCVGALAAGLFGKSVNGGSDLSSAAAQARMGEAVSRVHCTAARHPRALAGQELQSVLRSVCCESGSGSVADQAPAVLSVSEALQQALTQCRAEVRDIKAKRGVVVVCGTFFIMSEARAALGIVEPRDGDFLADGVRDVQENFAEGVNVEKVI